LPIVSIGVGSLSIADCCLLALIGLIVIRHVAEKSVPLLHTPLDLPLLGFFALALVSTAVALMEGGLEFKPAMKEVRLVTYYLSFFVVTNLVRQKKQQQLLLRGVLTLASAVAIGMIIQYALGASAIILPGRIEQLRTQNQAYDGITRVLPPGQSIVLVGFVITTMRLALEKLKPKDWWRLLQWALLGFGVLVTFNRVYWVGVALVMTVALYLVRGETRRRLLARGLIFVTIVVLFALALSLNPDLTRSELLTASLSRLNTLVSGTAASEQSLQFRYLENDYALSYLMPPRILGLGLGAFYRPFTELDWADYDGRGYLHNGHFWLLIKAGFFAYLCFAWMSLSALHRGFTRWRHLPVEVGATTLGLALSFLIVLVGSMTSPMLMEWFWAPVVAVLLSLNELTFNAFPLTVPRQV
jgi:hypothetical protein